MTMADFDEFDILRQAKPPAPRAEARDAAMRAALEAFDDEKKRPQTQGMQAGLRLTDRVAQIWSSLMQKKLISAPAIAGLFILPVAGITAWQMSGVSPFGRLGGDAEAPGMTSGKIDGGGRSNEALEAKKPAAAEEASRDLSFAPAPAPKALETAGQIAPSIARTPSFDKKKAELPPADVLPEAENRDRIEGVDTNPVRAALENPVSTFSIDVDTASWAFVRRQLNHGVMPDPDTVRVEEMINYFPYDWKGPDSAAVPFNAQVSVMPTPWNAGTKLMHVAIQGYDVVPAEKPKSNLVFLVDTSGSMNQPDKLPLLKTSFRMLLDTLGADDTVSIVAYAGESGTALEPTKASDKAKILDALDKLGAGGSTAGASGIEQAYKLAEQNFVKDGVNRVLLATDGDFNVGPSDDESLKRLIEKKRQSGVFLSVFGFGQGNYNDQLMQTLAQNGNGVAAYIDTVSEARKAFVEEASSTLFAIAKDVKIQVEFNPERVAEYRLIGYETRALNREDFNNDRVDAGDIGSGHSVTAIYEITPKGSAATLNDPLRYGQADTSNGTVANASEYAFVKMRYKLPNEDISKLITTPVTTANEIADFAAASDDQRFSVAVAAYGQKLRDTDQLAGFGYDKIAEIAAKARGDDPFGYRAEFLQMVRVTESLAKN